MRPSPRLNTAQPTERDGSRQHKTYSWVETPRDLRSGQQISSTRRADIPPLPSNPALIDGTARDGAEQLSSSEFPQDMKLGLTSPYNLPPPQGTHPAQFAPYAEHSPRSPERTGQKMTLSPISTRREDYSSQQRPRQISSTDEPRKPPTSPRSPRIIQPDSAVLSYRPDVATGPNSPPIEMHIPGQIAHPNQQIKGGSWRHGLCDCTGDMSICCTGLICPCIIYGKSQYRLSQRSEKKDPTNMLDYDACNGSCTVMGLLCACGWILAAIQHTRTRKIYNIPGGVGSDCLRALCCCCCTLIQDEKEIKEREERARKLSGASSKTTYIPPEAMNYAPPPR
ncbi:MAG: hypothetical protein Q9227_002765 [Pyrenula ochraceoflavens]